MNFDDDTSTTQQQPAADAPVVKTAKERGNEQQRARYAANREKRLKQRRARYAANREKRLEQERARYAANPEKYRKRTREQQRARRAANPEKYREKERARRGLKTQFVYKLMVMQRGRCAICAVDVTEKHHMDHIIAVARGGKTELTNLQLLCRPCNHEKAARDAIEHMQSKGKLL